MTIRTNFNTVKKKSGTGGSESGEVQRDVNSVCHPEHLGNTDVKSHNDERSPYPYFLRA